MPRSGAQANLGLSFGIPWCPQEPLLQQLLFEPIGRALQGGHAGRGRATRGSRKSLSAGTSVRGSSKCFGNYPSSSCPKCVHLQRDCCLSRHHLGGEGCVGSQHLLAPTRAPAIPLPLGSRLGGCGVKPALLAPAATSRARGMLRSEPTPTAPAPAGEALAPRGGGGGDGGVVRVGCCLCRCHSFSGRVAGPREWLLRAEAAPSKSAERCWCQPGKDQSLYQRVCVGGLIFVCRSQMVKEESDIIARAGAMKRVGERKSPGEARPEERGPVPPSSQSGVSSRGPTSTRVCRHFSSASCRDLSRGALGHRCGI